ncbi:MAG: tyrosine-type recombinase/integrase [Candidatus Jordarchaeaceae archaeon]
MDREGFEPSASPMPRYASECVFKRYDGRMENERECGFRIEDSEGLLAKFQDFCLVNMRLAPRTVKNTMQDVKRFLKVSEYSISYEAISNYLKHYLGKAPETYNSQIKSLRRFIREFLGLGRLISSFKIAPVDDQRWYTDLTKAQVKRGFLAQPDSRSKAIYLFTATTGLRKSEILSLKKENVDFKLRAVRPEHFTRKKRSGVTFYNKEAEEWLMRYLEERRDNDQRLFVISDRQWKYIWERASKAAGVKITAQALRLWFSTEMGELGVPDRYVDVFQGRALRNVIAKHYTGKGLERLKRIYNKADLRVLS